MDAHQRYERMAVGHVLGGLDEVDAAAFRAHLVGCRDCRKRVNELRDIASDLATAAREERAAVRSAIEVEKRTDQDAPEAVEVAPARQWPWGVVLVSTNDENAPEPTAAYGLLKGDRHVKLVLP